MISSVFRAVLSPFRGGDVDNASAIWTRPQSPTGVVHKLNLLDEEYVKQTSEAATCASCLVVPSPVVQEKPSIETKPETAPVKRSSRRKSTASKAASDDSENVEPGSRRRRPSVKAAGKATEASTPTAKSATKLTKVKTEPTRRSDRASRVKRKGFYNETRLIETAWKGTGTEDDPVSLS